MENKKLFIEESIMKYEAYKLNDLDLLATFFNAKVIESITKEGVYKIQDLKEFSLKELAKLKGIGKANAIKLLALYEINKRKSPIGQTNQIITPKDVFDICSDIEYEEQEVVKLLCLDTKNNIIKNINVFKGGINNSIVDIKVVLKEALRCNSTSIILVHNHPSGDSAPSDNDIALTKRLKEASDIISISLLDHIIIGKGKYTSLSEKGVI